MNADSHHTVRIGSERNFGLVFAVVFALIALWLLLPGGSVWMGALVLAGIMVLIAFVYPKLLKPLNTLWFKFGMTLGKVVAPIILSVLFVLVVVPTGLVAKLLGKDPLGLRKKEGAGSSYWITRSDEDAESSMNNQY